MIKKQIQTTFIEYESLEELEKNDRDLIHQAEHAAAQAYAPYSKFKVGAAILLENGKIIQGNNQENAAYPSGLCAERVALFYANSQYPDCKVKSMAIAAISDNKLTKLPVTPCGSCRQVIIETQKRFNEPIRIILYGKDKIITVENAGSLLPMSFDEDFLKKREE